MALGIFDKVVLIVKGDLHALLDKKINMDSPEAVAQLIRELEEAMKGQSQEKIRAQYEASAFPGKIATMQKEAKTYEDAIERILGDDDPENDKDAEPLAAHLTELEAEIAELTENESVAKERAEQQAQLFDQLKDRHKNMVRQLQQLRTLKREAKKDKASQESIDKIKSLTEGVDSLNLGGALENARAEAEVSRLGLKEALGSVQSSPEAILKKSQAADRVAQIRAKLAAKNAGQ